MTDRLALGTQTMSLEPPSQIYNTGAQRLFLALPAVATRERERLHAGEHPILHLRKTLLIEY